MLDIEESKYLGVKFISNVADFAIAEFILSLNLIYSIRLTTLK